MFQRILVPIDGSPLAERALPMAETIARAQGAELFLTRAVEPPPWLGFGPDANMDARVYQELVDALEVDAQGYLSRVQARVSGAGLSAHTALLRGAPAATILDYESQIQPDLVILASHGRTGLARFALGSVADLLVREGSAPVLVVRSFNPALGALDSALVPMDGSALAEQALPVVETLAGRPLQRVRLLQAIAAAEDRQTAVSYLDQVAARLVARGLTVDIDVRTEEPSDAIHHAAASTNLVILSTHGRGGRERFRYGSVAERAMRQLATPMLLVRARPETIQA